MKPSVSKIAITLTTLFIASILFSCNPWRRGSTIKGSGAKNKHHTRSASSKRR